MKRMHLILCAILLAFGINFSQNIKLLNKGEIFHSNESSIVVMPVTTFAKYHYSQRHLDSLKSLIVNYDSVVEKQRRLANSQILNYQNLLVEKDLEIETYRQSYEKLKVNTNTCIENQTRLEIEYKKLQNKKRNSNRWRNFFIGTSSVLASIIVLSVIK